MSDMLWSLWQKFDSHGQRGQYHNAVAYGCALKSLLMLEATFDVQNGGAVEYQKPFCDPSKTEDA